VDRSDVASWLDRYISAWESGDRSEIGDLFAADAIYRYHPYDDPVRGRDAIVESWFEEPDEPGSFEASYEPYAIEGDRAVAVGTSTYASGDVYDNVFTLRFDDDGRCSEFTEWFMKRP
jgi:ketosteroid isomerase-like protein